MARNTKNTVNAPRDQAAETLAAVEAKREPSKLAQAWDTAKPHVVANAVEGARYTGIAIGIGVLYAIAIKAAGVTYNAMS